MKKTIFLGAMILFFGCANNAVLENCLQTLPLNINTDLNNPQLINAQTPGGFAELSGGSKGILLFNINGSDFVAYDRLCPNNDCANPMAFENGLILKCP
ncbi:MAG: phosphoribosylaminoimidazole carboxylase, partial [Polaribacter sp.]